MVIMIMVKQLHAKQSLLIVLDFFSSSLLSLADNLPQGLLLPPFIRGKLETRKLDCGEKI